jgi:hypothetical protein
MALSVDFKANDEDFLAKANDFVAKSKMSVEEAEAYFQSMGITPVFTEYDVT